MYVLTINGISGEEHDCVYVYMRYGCHCGGALFDQVELVEVVMIGDDQSKCQARGNG